MSISKKIKELNKQLYPDGRAWQYARGSEQVETGITRFVDGLGNPFVDGQGNAFVQNYGSEASPGKRLINAMLLSYTQLFTDSYSLLNQILADNADFDEEDATNWERVFGLTSTGLTLEERKANILRKQSYPNGVAERGHYLFIQEQLQASGFDVYVTENRFPDGAGNWYVQTPSTNEGIANSIYTGSNLSIGAGTKKNIFNSDGTKIYVTDQGSVLLTEYNLSTAWDLSTATIGNTYDMSTNVWLARGLYIKADNTTLYVNSSGDRRIAQYAFGTPGDITTLSYVGSWSYPVDRTVYDIVFRPDGERIYLQLSTGVIEGWPILTPWDITSVSVVPGLSYDTSGEDSSSQSVRFSTDGFRMYTLGGASQNAYEYILDSPYNIPTAELSTQFYAPQPASALSINLQPGETTFYILGAGVGFIYEYTQIPPPTVCANYIEESIDSNFFNVIPAPAEFGEAEFGIMEFGEPGTLSIEERNIFTFFINGPTFPQVVNVPLARKDEFRQLILKLKPAHTAVYLYVNYI